MPPAEGEHWSDQEGKGVFSRLFYMGIPDDAPLEDKAAFCTVNVATLIGFLLALIWVPLAYIITASVALVLTNALFTVLYLCLLVTIHLLGHRAVRLGLTAVMSAHWITICLMTGAFSGTEAYLILILITLVMSYTRMESRARLMALCIPLVASAGLAWFFVTGPEPDVSVSVQRIAGFYLVLAVVVGFAGFIIYHLHFSSINNYAQLRHAREKSSGLLKLILPEMIAERVEKGEELLANSHGDAAVLFADLVNFAELAQSVSPRHLVDFLNELFVRFDELAETEQVEKIKTIGGCYMAATGVLGDDGQSDVAGLFRLALKMRGLVGEIAESHGFDVQVRLGISAGHVVSGVIGRHRKTFDLWGETVNLASRMESTAAAGSIQVSESAYWRLKSQWSFNRQSRVNVKGVGEVDTYLYTGEAANSA
jgi:class 3 adenylate cyclase